MSSSLEPSIDSSALLGTEDEHAVVPLADLTEVVRAGRVKAPPLVLLGKFHDLSLLFLVKDNDDWLALVVFVNVHLQLGNELLLVRTLDDSSFADGVDTMQLLILALELQDLGASDTVVHKALMRHRRSCREGEDSLAFELPDALNTLLLDKVRSF